MTLAPRAFVIGHPIAHSRSPLLHGYWLREHGLAGSYDKIDVAPADLAAFLDGMAGAGFVGGNVTVPHKTEVLRLLGDDVDEAARSIGAVNTLWFEDGRLRGGNTDAAGFLANLDETAPGWDRAVRSALVLGAGGAARAVVYGLRRRGVEVVVVNRTFETAAALAADFAPGVVARNWAALGEAMAGAGLLVNTTALGMRGKPPLAIDLAPLPATALVSDIVYVPLDTALLRDARARGHRTVGGLGMLLHQAVPGFARWFGVTPTVTSGVRALLEDDVRAAG